MNLQLDHPFFAFEKLLPIVFSQFLTLRQIEYDKKMEYYYQRLSSLSPHSNNIIIYKSDEFKSS